jgi:hypothetical protein
MEYVSNDSVPTPARDAMNKYMLYVQDSYDSKKAAIDLAAALSVENARAANGDGVEEQVVAVDAQAPERYEDAVLQLTTGVDDALEEELVADMEELLTSVDNVKRRTMAEHCCCAGREKRNLVTHRQKMLLRNRHKRTTCWVSY